MNLRQTDENSPPELPVGFMASLDDALNLSFALRKSKIQLFCDQETSFGLRQRVYIHLLHEVVAETLALALCIIKFHLGDAIDDAFEAFLELVHRCW